MAIAGQAAGLAVDIDLLLLGGETVPRLVETPVTLLGDVLVASLIDLWILKAKGIYTRNTTDVITSRPEERVQI